MPENTGINRYIIKIEENKQPPYRLIYALSPVELKTLKTYMETHLETGFIQSSKLPTGDFILLDKKLDSSPYLCVDYWDFYKLTIKNC